MLNTRQGIAAAQTVAALGAAARLQSFVAFRGPQIPPAPAAALWICIVMSLAVAVFCLLDATGATTPCEKSLEFSAAFYSGLAVLTGYHHLDWPLRHQATHAGVFAALALLCLGAWAVRYRPFTTHHPYRHVGDER